MKEEINIQWFPGHMTKARRMISDCVKQVDAVCEIIDARIPISSRNPDLPELIGSKPKIVILNRVDQADPEAVKIWRAFFKAEGTSVIEADSKTGKGTKAFASTVNRLLSERIEQYKSKGQIGRQIRIMVVGIPNVGKSSFINKIAGRRATAAEDRPGLTRGKQWIKIDKTLELLDTPGILWPKFENQTVGEHLAYTGAVKDDILDKESLASNLMVLLSERYSDRLAERYKLTIEEGMSGFDMLTAAGKKRGFLLSGGVVDTERMANILLDEFRGGKLGRITLELPGDIGE